jgi:cation diffusion facilitator family transporter
VSALGLTIAKFLAWRITDSVGFYSDMLESLTVAIGAAIAMVAIRVSSQGPDARHAFGHAKAEYFASFLDSVLLLMTAVLILISSIERLRHPHPLESGWLGTAIALGSCFISLYFARQLFKTARIERSISLEAEARHLVVAALISICVVLGVILTVITGWQRLDPAFALIAGIAAAITGFIILADSLQGLMDSQIDHGPMSAIQRILADDAAILGIAVRSIRTRTAGAEDFVEVTVAMPEQWTINQAQKAILRLEHDLTALQPGRHVTITLARGDDDGPTSTPPPAMTLTRPSNREQDTHGPGG